MLELGFFVIYFPVRLFPTQKKQRQEKRKISDTEASGTQIKDKSGTIPDPANPPVIKENHPKRKRPDNWDDLSKSQKYRWRKVNEK